MVGYIIAAIIAFCACGGCIYALVACVYQDEAFLATLSFIGIVVTASTMATMIFYAVDEHATSVEKVIEVKEITQIDTLKLNDEVIGYKLLVIK